MLAARADSAPRSAAADLVRAETTYAAMAAGFRRGDGYTETPGGETAYVWPFSQALAAGLAMAELPHAGGAYLSPVADDVDALARYWLTGPPGAYGALPGRPDSFYDDNEWIGLDLVAAAHLLHRPDLLARAGAISALVSTAWSRETAVCPGGVYWQRTPPDRDRAAVATANGALLALELYGATGRRPYVAQAGRMVGWLTRCLQRPDGLIANDIDAAGTTHDRAWSYNQGAAIADLVLLARATRRLQYLAQAQGIAAAALDAYGPDFAGEPRVFVAIFFRDLALLDTAAPDPRYRSALATYAELQWRHGRDRRTGLFGADGSYDLLDQAAMVQLYAQLSR